MGFDWDKDTGNDLPPGEYECRFVKLELAKSKSGNTVAKYQAKVISGLYTGRMTFPSIVLVDTAMWKLKALLKACGCTPTAAQKKCEFGTEEFYGLLKLPLSKTCLITVEDQKNSQFKNHSFRSSTFGELDSHFVGGPQEDPEPWEPGEPVQR